MYDAVHRLFSIPAGALKSPVDIPSLNTSKVMVFTICPTYIGAYALKVTVSPNLILERSPVISFPAKKTDICWHRGTGGVVGIGVKVVVGGRTQPAKQFAVDR